ncbi:unnamed protein product [Effrenium voratum]|nr:unnamed protein product [Effrenium voratum]
MAMPPLKRAGAKESALKSELKALRLAQGKLEALDKGCATGARATPEAKAKFVFDLELDRFFAAWSAVCKDMRSYWRRRRDENSRRWLGTRSRALSLWSLFSCLRRYVDRPLQKPARGARVRHKNTTGMGQMCGTFFSCSERGVCKILWDGTTAPSFVGALQLVEICSLPHPFLAGLAFLAWSLAHAHDEDLKIDGLRTALMFNQVMGKSSGKLTMMAVMQEESIKGLKFCFAAWKKAVKSRSLQRFRVRRAREVFRAWLEVLLMEQHDRAAERLEAAEMELRRAGLSLERRHHHAARLEDRMAQAHLRCVGLFCAWVVSSWRMVVLYRHAQEAGREEARKALALSALQLAESMGQVSADFCRPHLQAWAGTVKHSKRLKRAAEGTIQTLVGSSISAVFKAWKLMKLSDYQAVAAALHARSRSCGELRAVAEGLVAVGGEAARRLRASEAALRAADRALHIGAARGDALEAEIRRLRLALKGHVQDAGTQGIQLKEEMEQHCSEHLAALSDHGDKIRAELRASLDMEARLQKVWRAVSEGSELTEELQDHESNQCAGLSHMSEFFNMTQFG